MLQGKWLGQNDAQCAIGMSFTGSAYESDFVCQLGSGFGLQADVGTFDVGNASLSFSAEQSTCPASARRNWSTGFAVEGDTLKFLSASGVLLYSRVSAMPGGTSGQVTFGCFDDKGAFTAAPLQPVR